MSTNTQTKILPYNFVMVNNMVNDKKKYKILLGRKIIFHIKRNPIDAVSFYIDSTVMHIFFPFLKHT